MKKVTGIKVRGSRWFQKSYGNTYHTVYIYVVINGKVSEFYVPFTYGYGDSYEQSAFEKLITEGILQNKRDMQTLYSYCRDNNLEYDYSVIDVNRKKDLY